MLATGDGWFVEDVLCTFGSGDATFEERHSRYRIAIVGAGMFQCRSPRGRELLTSGSLLLGEDGECFECGHEHGSGDWCLAFGYAPGYFERLAADAGVHGKPRLRALRVPSVRATAPIVTEACAMWSASTDVCDESPAQHDTDAWEDLGVRIAAAAVELAADTTRSPRAPPKAERGAARAARLIDRDPRVALTLSELAREAHLSRYHFLRTFARVTGLTPRQYVLRARLRSAAVRLATGDERVIDVALDCGFRDISNFNRAFHAEFGRSPTEERARLRGRR
jgi:AraC family transcriptional regulator